MGIETASFSPDARTLITGSSDGYLCEWDVDSGERRRVLLDPRAEEDERPRVVIVQEDGREEDAPFQLRRLSEAMRGSPILCVRFAPDGKRFVVGAENGQVVIWNARSRGELFAWEAHDCLVSAVELSPDGRLLATGSSENYGTTLRVWRVSQGGGPGPDEVFSDRWHSGGVSSVSFSSDSRFLAAGGYTDSDRTGPVLYDLSDGTRIGSSERDTTSALQLSPDGRLLATGDVFGTFSLWSVDRQERVFSEDAHRSLIAVVQFSPEGSCAASGDEAGAVNLWSVATHQRTAQWTFPGAIRALCLSVDGRELLMAEAAEGGDRPVIHRVQL